MPNYSDLAIFSGNSHPALAKAICQHLGTTLRGADVFQFSNENIFVRLHQSVRSQDVFVVQTFSSPVNHNIMELLIMLDTIKRASAGRITAVIPYFAYGRTDRKNQPRVPITARLLADLIATAGADRFLTLDLHAGQIQGFFSIPGDELTALSILSRHFVAKHWNPAQVVVVATDIGAAKKAEEFAHTLKATLAIVQKHRFGDTGRTQALNLIGEVEGKTAILYDDEIDTGGSLLTAAEIVLHNGAAEVYACCTHPVLSGPAVERLRNGPFKEIVVTDTIPLPPAKQLPQIIVLSVAPLLGEVIRRIHRGSSVGEIFRE